MAKLKQTKPMDARRLLVNLDDNAVLYFNRQERQFTVLSDILGKHNIRLKWIASRSEVLEQFGDQLTGTPDRPSLQDCRMISEWINEKVRAENTGQCG